MEKYLDKLRRKNSTEIKLTTFFYCQNKDFSNETIGK